ncbi:MULTISPECIES: hypothetical protein [Gracilibacillus]|uniref:Uncharacterized protein n=1 Tax=Gracilibacillus dipsosauri TaxID=178340 RepID=A0A317KYF4_9BACI|nr:hypothetical protein [Gracilibacillus dipsosauri]PWU67770.1 hypothetical protein DLJ74_15055 [Gracilibacillus dipsosauri]
MDVYDQKLVEEQEKKRKVMRLQREKKKLTEELNQLTNRQEDLYHKLQEEKVDVEKLEGFSVANLFYTLSGKKLEKLDKEKQELAIAQLQYEEAKEAVNDLKEDLEVINQQIRELGDPDTRFHQLLKEKYEQLLNTNDPKGKEALQLLEHLGTLKDEKKEIAEAIQAGDQVKSALNNASISLDKAKNWGTADMFGGGFISTSLKHSHIDDARRSSHNAQRLLRKFSHELADIGESFQADINISGGLTFADYFLDGLVMDWFVQDKINQSANEVNSMREKVSQTVTQLKKLEKDIVHTITHAESEWENLIFQA